MAHEYPKNFARFYDLIYHTQRDGVDNTFFQNKIKETKGKILEVGVGTGRMFAEALSGGADIYGIDISPNMLDVLKSKVPPNQAYRISCQNIIDFSFEMQFDLIIAPFRVIMHLQDKNDQLRALNNVWKHLAKGGRFIFDTFIPDLKALINGLDKVCDFEGEYEPGRKVRRIVSTKPDLLKQLININFRLEWETENNLKAEEWDFPLRYFFRYELEHLVERSLFEEYRMYGDYNEKSLDNDSRDYIIICKKT
jgi:SAM-dependent methyltransferase